MDTSSPNRRSTSTSFSFFSQRVNQKGNRYSMNKRNMIKKTIHSGKKCHRTNSKMKKIVEKQTSSEEFNPPTPPHPPTKKTDTFRHYLHNFVMRFFNQDALILGPMNSSISWRSSASISGLIDMDFLLVGSSFYQGKFHRVRFVHHHMPPLGGRMYWVYMEKQQVA